MSTSKLKILQEIDLPSFDLLQNVILIQLDQVVLLEARMAGVYASVGQFLPKLILGQRGHGLSREKGLPLSRAGLGRGGG